MLNVAEFPPARYYVFFSLKPTKLCPSEFKNTTKLTSSQKLSKFFLFSSFPLLWLQLCHKTNASMLSAECQDVRRDSLLLYLSGRTPTSTVPIRGQNPSQGEHHRKLSTLISSCIPSSLCNSIIFTFVQFFLF